ncbi:glycosyltransferase family 4 protein [Patescibacteria group bacterium]|nr:glycosyltransferase family 4 protein [Patescibacteria group bacterium]
MKTRILFVIDGMEFGGGERGFAQIINGLPASRYETFLASGPQETLYHAVSNSPVQRHPVDFSNRCNPSVLIDLIRIIKNNRINIVHGQGARADFYARLASGFSRKTRYVSTVQMPVEGYDVGPMKMMLYRGFDRFSEKFVDRFLVVSSVLEQAMIQRHGIPREKVVKIYNGIETDRYKPHEQEVGRRRIRQEYSVNESEILIGSLGRLVWQKGFEYFLQSIPALIQDIPKVRFMLVGEGPLRKELERLAISLGIHDRLVFTGHRSDIRDIISAMDVVVIPSLLEGFPMVTLEAMAMEKPIVTTAIDGIMEQITDDREGLLIAPKSPLALAQAVKRLVDDPGYARSLGINARAKVVRDFSVDKMITETIRVYETL